MTTKVFQLNELLDYQPKSHRKAGDGLESGMYPFFTSSQQQTKWLEEADYQKEAIILGTGGAPSVHCAQIFSTSADVFVFAPKSTNISAKYICYFLRGHKDILERGFKGAGLKHLSRDYTSKICIPLPVDSKGNPNIKEQKRIVSLLEEAEELKQKRAEANHKMTTVIPALFNKMFGNPIQNDKNWPKAKLKSFATVITGNTPPRANIEFYGSDVEWIKSDNILEFQIYPTEAKEYLSELGVKRGRITDKDAILMTCIAGSLNTIGNVCLTDRRVAFNQQINAIEVNDETNPLFLYALLKNSKKQLHKSASHVLKHIINKTSLECVDVIRPPFSLQNEFAEKAREFLHFEAKQNESAAKIDALFSSLLSKAFTSTT